MKESIEFHGFVEGLSVGPLNKTRLQIRGAASACEREIVVFVTNDEAKAFYPGTDIKVTITPASAG